MHREGSGADGPSNLVMNRHKQNVTWRGALSVLGIMILLILTAGCARSPGVGASSGIAGTAGAVPGPRLAQAAGEADEADDYDPWQPFNERMFWFNHDVLDRYVIKPAAQGWEKILPEVARRSIGRVFDNLDMPRRLVNNLLQARPVGAGRELARFAVNSTVGLVGLMDVATLLHIQPSDADAGQTLALYGVGPGPYLVLPTMPPGTVRDAIGRGVDGALDPIGYFLPFVANRAKSIVIAVNKRSLHLELFDNVEDSVVDLYSAARNGYLQRRRRAVQLAFENRSREWMWMQPEHTELALAGHEDPS